MTTAVTPLAQGQGPATRLAPTPSGLLHAGNALGFLLTRTLADRLGARLRLRIDDLDMERVRPEYMADIFESLEWLGITWEEGPQSVQEHREAYGQALRIPAYHRLLEDLVANDAVFACTCTRSASRVQGTGTVCGSGCERRGLDVNDPQAVLRLRVPPDTMITVPAVAGPDTRVDVYATLGQPVLRQRPTADGPGRPAYQVASLADDMDMHITHIVRGVDLLPSTACQLYLAELLGLHRFLRVRFLHHELVLNERGEKLSKSAGAASLRAMRERGEGPEALVAQAERLIARVP